MTAAVKPPATCVVDPKCTLPPVGRGEYPQACTWHQPDTADYWPVIVTYTQHHVVWVAAEYVDGVLDSGDLYELTSAGTLADSGFDAHAPRTKRDWRLAYEVSEFGYDGLHCDAHIKSHRAELRRVERDACAAAGHPEQEPPTSAIAPRPWCPTCRRFLDVPAAASEKAEVAS